MFATISLDGLACIYIIPNKLFSIIKHSNKYYDKIFLSSNPFPTIITYEKQNNTLTSYSINGILIKQKHITMDEIDITGVFKFETNVPFFVLVDILPTFILDVEGVL